MRLIPWTVAALLVCLPACITTVQRPGLTGNTDQIKTAVSRACPRPSSPAKIAAITAELESLDAGGMVGRVDTLATEWERLNDGARACKGNAK